jgi:hypothetical protein
MSTAADANRPYRSGVLVGNWSEDKHGSQLCQLPPGNDDHQFHSIARLSYRGATMEAVNEYRDSLLQPPGLNRTGVEAKTLFGHKGTPHETQFYLSTYNSSWNKLKTEMPEDPSLLGKLADRAEETRDVFVPRELDYSVSSQSYGSATRNTTRSSVPWEDTFVPRATEQRKKTGRRPAAAAAAANPITGEGANVGASRSNVGEQQQQQQQQQFNNEDEQEQYYEQQQLEQQEQQGDQQQQQQQQPVVYDERSGDQMREWNTQNGMYGQVQGHIEKSRHARFVQCKPAEVLSRATARVQRVDQLGPEPALKSGCSTRPRF